MKNNQEEISVIEGPSVRPIFDGAGDYERCSKCAAIHWVGWPCYYCTEVRARIRKRGFVNPVTPYPKYLASTLRRCTHCGLAIWERTRRQTFHHECKYLWDQAKLKIYHANHLIWWIRKQGYYVRDGVRHGIAGMTDEAILVAVGQGLPVEIVYENKQDSGFRFVKVEFRGDYPWRPDYKRATALPRIAEYEARKTLSKPLLDEGDFLQVQNFIRQRLRVKRRDESDNRIGPEKDRRATEERFSG